MKFVALIFALLSYSISAMDDPLIRLYEQRLNSGSKNLEELQNEIITTLGAQKDPVLIAQESIEEKVSRLLPLEGSPFSDLFRAELGEILLILAPCEQLITKEQRRQLLAEVSLKPFEPYLDTIEKLRNFSNKWQAINAYAELLTIAVNQMDWFHKEWEEFTKGVCAKLGEFDLSAQDLLEIYHKFIYFHKELNFLTNNYQNLKQKLKSAQTSLPKPFLCLETIHESLIALYKSRASVLWNLLYNSICLPGLEKDYHIISDAIFLESMSPLKKFLDAANQEPEEEQSDEEQSSIRPTDSSSVPEAGQLSITSVERPLVTTPSTPNSLTPHPIRTNSTQSLPTTPSKPRSNVRYNSPKTSIRARFASSSPMAIRPNQKSKRSSTVSFSAGDSDSESSSLQVFEDGTEKNASSIRKITKAFALPSWSEQIKDFKRCAQTLKNISFILEPFDELLKTYDQFKFNFLSNLERAEDILTPRARLCLYGQPSYTIFQSTARKICSIMSNGPLCYGIPNEMDSLHPLELCIKISNLEYAKKSPLFPNPSRVGERYAQYWFATLFGIPCEPFAFTVVDDLLIQKPNTPKRNANQYVLTLNRLNNPSTWAEQTDHDFITVRKTNTDILLADWLTEVMQAKRLFTELNEHSYGMLTLFSILTQSQALRGELVLIPDTKGGTYSFKLKGYNPFLQPSFQRQDGTHQFIGKNILLLFPQANHPIPADVIKDFSKHNIVLILSLWAQQCAKQQDYFDLQVEKYQLAQIQDLLMVEDEIDFKLDVALGLRMASHPGTTKRIISNFQKMLVEFNKTNVTYLGILETLSKPEAFCYTVFRTKAQNEIDKRKDNIFYEHVAPTLLGRLRTINQEKVLMGDQPLCPPEEFQVWEDGIRECQRSSPKKDSLPTNLQSFLTKKYTWTLQAGIFDVAVTQKAWEYLTADDVISVYEEFFFENKVREFFIDCMPKLIERIYDLNQESQSREEEPLYSLTDIKNLTLGQINCREIVESKNFISRSALLAYFLLNDYPENVKKLIPRKLEEYLSNGAEHIFDDLNPDSSSVVKSTDIVFGDEVPILTHSYPDYIACVIEANEPIGVMIQDLIDNADFSNMPPSQVLYVFELLHTLNSNPNSYHTSWGKLVPLAREEYRALPPKMMGFIQNLGLRPEQEKAALERAQLQRHKEYEQHLKSLKKQFKKIKPTEEQLLKLPGYIFRQLLTGSLPLVFGERSGTEVPFLTGLCDTFLFPPYSCLQPSLILENDPGCLGLVSNPEGINGMFELHPYVGDHYPLSWSEYFITQYHASDALPENARVFLASHNQPLFTLYFLHAVQNYCPTTNFHPWFFPKFRSSFTDFQNLLLSRRNITFKHFLSAVRPESCFLIEQKFKAYLTADKPVGVILKNLKTEYGDLTQRHIERKDRKGSANLTPIQDKTLSLDRTFDGKKNIVDLLHEWDELREMSVSAAPLTIDDAATQTLSYVNPSNYSPEILARILHVVTKFKIDFSQINSDFWKNPQILTELLRIEAPMKCIELAVSLRIGYSITIINNKKGSVTISETKGNMPLLCELISLFPQVEKLHICNNSLRTLTPLQSTLQNLQNLTMLNLESNPLQNPAPLALFTQLRNLNLSQTFIPSESLDELRLLITSNTKLAPLPLLTEGTYMNNASSECEVAEYRLTIPLDSTETDPLLVQVASLMKSDNPQNHPLIAYILSRLAETSKWDHILSYKDINFNGISNYFPKLWSIVNRCESRMSAKQLLFALGNHLPVGTTRQHLLFQHNGNGQANGSLQLIQKRTPEIRPLEPCDLLRIKVMGQAIGPTFFETFLPACQNLKTLILTGSQLPNILECIPSLPNLELLDLSNNTLSSLKGLHTIHNGTKFQKLATLVLHHNNIISGKSPNYNGILLLLELEDLVNLDLRYNNLTAIPLLGNKTFRYLDLRNNQIKDKKGKKNSETDERKFYIDPQKDEGI